VASELARVLADIQRRASDPGVTYRQGLVVAWSGPAGNTITVGGVDLANLPYLDGVTATAGDSVALLRCANTLLVVGVIVQP
jgi:hypothetical protein